MEHKKKKKTTKIMKFLIHKSFYIEMVNQYYLLLNLVQSV